MMRVLITGATGFIGSHLAEKLHEKGYELRCVVRNTSNLQWLKHLPIEYIYGDLFDETVLKKAVTEVDYIYNVAGITKAKTKKEYYKSNHEATKNLLEITLKYNPHLKRFVHISSGTVVGPGKDRIASTEETPCHPITTYGKSKLEAEKECLKIMDKLPITIVRPPAVYGPRDKDIFEFFNTMNKSLQPMIGFRDTYVSLIHVKDLVTGIVLAGEHPKAVGQTYFISSERFYNWKEIGELTATVMKKKVFRIRIPKVVVYIISAIAEFASLFSKKPALLNFEKARDLVQKAWIFSIEKSQRELGFQESVSMKEGVLNTVQWYREQGWLK